MPIHPENAHRYPPEWPDISRRIRFERAEGRCECTGQCGTNHALEDYSRILGGDVEPEGLSGEIGRCGAVHGRAHPVTGSVVVLTTAHLDHTPENVDDANLLAACQRCHLRYDREHHAESRARRAAAALEAAGHLSLDLDS